MLPTVTIESTRHLVSTFDMGLLLGSVVAVAAIVWMMATHFKHDRHR